MDSLVIDQKTHLYNRSTSSLQQDAEKQLLKLYDEKYDWCRLTCSGINAIFMFFQSFLKVSGFNNNLVIAFSDELYSCTETKIMKWLSHKRGITIERFDVEHPESLLDYPTIDCVFFESCSNPTGKLFPKLEVIRQQILQKNKDCLFVADNTWLTPLIWKGGDKQVDFILDSCTKYISGGQCISGMMMGHTKSNLTRSITEDVDFNIRLMGLSVSPLYSEILLNSLQTIHDRLAISSQRTRCLLALLQPNAQLKIYYPFAILQSNAELKLHYPFALLQNTYIPAIIYMELHNASFKKFNNDQKNVGLFIQETCGIAYETSYGKPNDAICNWALKYKSKQKTVYIRLALGYEKKDDLNAKKLFQKLDLLFAHLF